MKGTQSRRSGPRSNTKTGVGPPSASGGFSGARILVPRAPACFALWAAASMRSGGETNGYFVDRSLGANLVPRRHRVPSAGRFTIMTRPRNSFHGSRGSRAGRARRWRLRGGLEAGSRAPPTSPLLSPGFSTAESFNPFGSGLHRVGIVVHPGVRQSSFRDLHGFRKSAVFGERGCQ